MTRLCLTLGTVFALFASIGLAQQTSTSGPYRVLKTANVGGAGGFDYVYQPAGEFSITGNAAHGAAVDPKSHHGFGSSKPVVMWDTTTLMPIETIDVEGMPPPTPPVGPAPGGRGGRGQMIPDSFVILEIER